MKNSPSILITGGAGYIGSHTLLELLRHGYKCVVIDNLRNSSSHSITCVSELTKKDCHFVEGDIRDYTFLERLFSAYKFDSVIHFAGLKSVADSVSNPLSYYDNNVYGTQVLLNIMKKFRVFKFVFSSSATIYGRQHKMPISELAVLEKPINPYGRSKLFVENILEDLAESDPRWRIAILRYFNPVGADASGLIGEQPNGTPSNLFPFICQVAIGKLPILSIFGDDYPTPDGTGMRDFIHVTDLAQAHLCSLNALENRSGVNIWNIGTGEGHSVLEILNIFEHLTEIKIPYKIAPRRPGDVPICFADPKKAEIELGWKAKKSLFEMVNDAWRWQTLNPNGFSKRKI